MNWELKAVVKGEVQGVGFRATVRRHALRLGITGLARNLPDGNVEIIAQGSLDALKKLLVEVQSEPGFAIIESIDTAFATPDERFNTFQIR
jgi:acylphosphatase